MSSVGLSSLSRLGSDLYKGVLDFVYPPYCLTCLAEVDEYLCAECAEKIDLIQPPFCRKCGVPCETYLCRDCPEREFAFESACSAGIYDGRLRDAVHQLKYGCHVVMADPLGELMARCFATTHLAGKVDLVSPVPIHITRLVQRGFNQSAELARVLCRRIGLPLIENVLVKPKKTRYQVDLPLEQRFTNLRGAFKVRRPDAVVGKRVLLVDDMLTTGATLNEAATTLRAAGASQVYGYTLARSI